MYQTLPNLVLGFHGCSRETYEKVLYKHEELNSSTNDYDWLGNGIYFWENSYDRALEWAQTHKADENPSVIGAVIDLGLCLNLSDYGCTQALSKAYDLLKYESENAEIELPQNRGIFVEGNAIYPNSGIFAKTHIQICVRNPNCIKGYFTPKEFNCDFTRI